MNVQAHEKPHDESLPQGDKNVQHENEGRHYREQSPELFRERHAEDRVGLANTLHPWNPRRSRCSQRRAS